MKYYFLKNFVLLEENNNEAIAGPNPPVTDLYKIVQTGIDQGNINTYQEQDYELILSDSSVGDTRVYAKYIGEKPTISLSGSNREVVTITCNKRPISFIVQGTSANTTDSARTIVFRGASIPGNTSSSNIVTPIITKVSSTLAEFGDPSPNNPYSIDVDNNPSVDIIGVGNSTNPSVTLKFGNLSFPNHILKFDW